jgi:hypothetical protein
MQTTFNKDVCSGTIASLPSGDVIVNGSLKIKSAPGTKVFYWAATPPTNGISFSGSGMPYPNPLVAYDRTPNKGVVDVMNGTFSVTMKYPNAYYIGLGSLYVPPHINFKVVSPGDEDRYFSVQVDDGIPFRMLTYPAPPTKNPRISPLFYMPCEAQKQARGQEAILRASAYPATHTMPDNFWGDRPTLNA